VFQLDFVIYWWAKLRKKRATLSPADMLSLAVSCGLRSASELQRYFCALEVEYKARKRR